MDEKSAMSGKNVIVTGASSGIGLATANLLASRGANVVLAARRTMRIEEAAARLRTEGRHATAVSVDVTDSESVDALVNRCVREFGGIDAVVSNAGVARLAPLADGSIDDWRAMVDVNLWGLLRIISAALPVFRRQGHGHIVSIVSTAGITISPTMGVYAATKNAARTVMEALRTESTDGVIRTTEISPGFVRTELADGMDDASREQIQVGMAAFGLDPMAVARAVGFAVEQPHDVEIGSMTIRPTVQG
jgi:NADP-dependent 3-hydroxy acid dehydrogenase YdfG